MIKYCHFTTTKGQNQAPKYFKMASYFDEHDCSPITDDEAANRMDFMRLLRLLLQNDSTVDEGIFERFLPHGERLAPPASISVVEELPRRTLNSINDEDVSKCPVCLVSFDEDDAIIEMPCDHYFHSDCLLPWLKKTNSCPLCRYELKTDDQSYEEYKLEKLYEEEREGRVKELHNSMFG